MLSEGQRRRGRGTQVVVGIVQTYGQPKTLQALLEGMEIVPQKRLEYRGTAFEEMDTGRSSRGLRKSPWWTSSRTRTSRGAAGRSAGRTSFDLLAAGITVITTVNVQHLASLNDVVATITGIRQQETVPDWVLDLADQVELMEISPYALQRRMMHGNLYPDPRKADLALRRFFTAENLTALRQLALMRVANLVDEELLPRVVSRPGSRDPRARAGLRVPAGLLGGFDPPGMHGSRSARGGELLVVHARTEDEPADPDWLREIERLTNDLGGDLRGRGRRLAGGRRPLVWLRAARHPDRGRRAPPFEAAGARARFVREPADPEGRRTSTST